MAGRGTPARVTNNIATQQYLQIDQYQQGNLLRAARLNKENLMSVTMDVHRL